MQVERLKKEHYEEFMDLIDFVFCRNLIKVNFEEDMPYIFKEDDEHMSWQYGCRNEKGKLVAGMGVIPYTYKIGDQTFKVRTITNVATHNRYMGQGYMQRLFDKVFEDMEAEDVDFVILHGHRERYRFTGFEMAGTSTEALFRSFNIQSFLKSGAKLNFTFKKLQDEDIEDIRFCKTLFDAEPQHYVRAEKDFMDCARTWQGEVYLVLNEKGERVGFFNCCRRFKNPFLREFLLTCPEKATEVIYSFMQQQNIDSLPVRFSPFDKNLVKNIYAGAEEVTTNQLNRINLLKPERLLEACLELKRQNSGYCPNGKIVIGCKFGNLLIENNNGFSVVKTEEIPDVIIPDKEIYTLLFGPRSADVDIYADVLKEKSAWFPVPIYIHTTELY